MGLLARIGGFFTREDVAKGTKMSGSDGVVTYGGYLPTVERSPELQGIRKWITYTNALNEGVVATGTRYFGNLLAGTSWHAEPNEQGGQDAIKAADIVTQGLLNAQMPKPWNAVVKKASMYRLYGHSVHEWATRTREDGMVVFANIDHRPQYTIYRWDKDDERKPWQGLWQRTRSGQELHVDRNQIFYCGDDALTDSPTGVGLLDHVIDLVRQLKLYRGLEGMAYQSDLGGLPIGRAPLGEFPDKASKDAATQNLRDFLEKRIRSPEFVQWFLMDSATYRGADPNTISQIQKWAVEILKSETANLPAIDAVIRRLQLEIARILGIEFVMVGGSGDGSYALHEDKTSMFATNLQATLTEIAAFAQNDLARPLVALNGLNPETCTPRLVAEPISTDAIEVVTKALWNIQMAGMQRNDPARDVLRRRMRLPPEPEPTAEELGMLPRTQGPAQNNLPGEVGPVGPGEDHSQESGDLDLDEEVNDLGDTSSSAPTNANTPAKMPPVPGATGTAPAGKPAKKPPPRKSAP